MGQQRASNLKKEEITLIKVVIAEDLAVLRESLKIIFKQDTEINVVGCAQNGREALELCGLVYPDLVLMDEVMPMCDGIEGLKKIKAVYPVIKIIMLATCAQTENVEKALRYGADGYILKDVEPQELIHIIRTTMKGMQTIHHSIYHTICRQLMNLRQMETPVDLTPREMEIIKMIVQGKSNKQIASSLYLSETRIKSIMTKILGKFQLADRTQLAVYAVRNFRI